MEKTYSEELFFYYAVCLQHKKETVTRCTCILTVHLHYKCEINNRVKLLGSWSNKLSFFVSLVGSPFCSGVLASPMLMTSASSQLMHTYISLRSLEG